MATSPSSDAPPSAPLNQLAAPRPHADHAPSQPGVRAWPSSSCAPAYTNELPISAARRSVRALGSGKPHASNRARGAARPRSGASALRSTPPSPPGAVVLFVTATVIPGPVPPTPGQAPPDGATSRGEALSVRTESPRSAVVSRAAWPPSPVHPNRASACGPPRVKCDACGPPCQRLDTASTTWSVAVRPNRASHACGRGSAGTLVTVAAGPAPAAVTARTATAYDCPLVRSRTVSSRSPPASIQVPLSSSAYSYRRIADPPSLAGAAQVSVTCASPGSPRRSCGAPGVVTGVAVTSAEGGPSVTPVRVAITCTVYAVPLMRLGIV